MIAVVASPPARDLAREAREARRIAVSHVVYDAYSRFDGTKLADMAYARLPVEKQWDARIRELEEAAIQAKRAGDKGKERELAHQRGELHRQRSEVMIREFLVPLLDNLVRSLGTNLIMDETYRMNLNPSVLAVETWRRTYVPGYGPPPKTRDQLAAEEKATTDRLSALAAKLGVGEKDRAGFVAYCRKAAAEWRRASELDSPAPRGHFLRTMGQSDRDFVENANPVPSIPQALALANGEMLTRAGLLSPHSPLMRAVGASKDPAAAVYLALLSRRPTARERAAWDKAAAAGGTVEDLVHALLNSKQFLFIQ